MRAMNKPLTAADSVPASPLAAEIARRRTFAIISHPDAGKTTLTEKLLLFGGAINLAGQVKAKRDRRSTRSDWMAIERERGISVVTSVMTFEYDGYVFNLLDTPGHEDFSEDTYRTLTAVDSAVMVIDAAKGIEARTRKLFEVCRLRDIPIVTFINKMDRESRDPFELLDEIEKTLALDTAPLTWPVGRGRDFIGTMELASGKVRLMEGDGSKAAVATRDRGRRDCRTQSLCSMRPRLPTNSRWSRKPATPFDLAAFREGHLTPVFFGSALKNFGVSDLLDALGAYAPSPRAISRPMRARSHADEPEMTAFVFKIQANMDPNHRDRIAFARLCSGKLTRGMKAKLTRTGKPMTLATPHFFFAQDRAIADEAYAGDVVGIPNHGTLAHRRHADRGRGDHVRRRAELCPGNLAPRATAGCDEGEEAQAGAAGTGGGGRGAGVPPARRRAGAGRRGRPAAARRAEGTAEGRVRTRGRLRSDRVPACPLDFWRAQRTSMPSSPPTAPASPRTWTATSCSSRATSSISIMRASGRRAFASTTSRTCARPLPPEGLPATSLNWQPACTMPVQPGTTTASSSWC